mmetsp:Transcript_38477/g.56171  ORF Transcript_38477/g.56171 Transcript_38477/m.56171 type:complete len:412 (+) Transcript_38477:117-1352(+)
MGDLCSLTSTKPILSDDQQQGISSNNNAIKASKNVICSLDDIQREAKLVLDKPLYEYLASGTDNEQTLRENRTSFQSWYLRPRMMRRVSNLSTQTRIFDSCKLSMPVFVTPAGVHNLVHKDGECATARACGRAGTIFCLSQHSTRSIEEVARAAPDTIKFYQAYILRDRSITLDLIQRAVGAGYKGIILTVDSVVFGFREADARNGFNALPPPHRLVNYDRYENKVVNKYDSKEKEAWDQNTEEMFDKNTSWEDLLWLKQKACMGLPLIVKGIMTAEDATLAVEHGADAIMVSNHGGRQLDGALPSIDALPEIVKAVHGRIPVLIDGGFRRGTDVLKAVGLGATAVGLGKPVFFSLAVGGEDGVVRMLQIVKKEIEAAMALCGCETMKDVVRISGEGCGLVTRHPFHRSFL